MCCLLWARGSSKDATGKEVVNILLERGDVNPDKSDIDGQTPLLSASKGYEGVVKILLGRDGVDPDKSDVDG